MFEGSSIAAVVPCYQEETQIRIVIETMPSFIDKIIIVDDRSPDRTAEIVRDCMKHLAPRIELPEAILKRARLPIERMLEISARVG